MSEIGIFTVNYYGSNEHISFHINSYDANTALICYKIYTNKTLIKHKTICNWVIIFDIKS